MLQFTEGTMNGRTPGYYKPIGDDTQGYKLTIPASVKKSDIYRFEELTDGTLTYTPVKT
jgi:hypothetical protein